MQEPFLYTKTTLMCALCGVILNDHWAEQDGGRRARAFRVALLDRVLDHFGLSLRDWAGGVYVLSDRKGGSAVVQDVGAVWSEAERLLGRPLDPLDEGLVAELSR